MSTESEIVVVTTQDSDHEPHVTESEIVVVTTQDSDHEPHVCTRNAPHVPFTPIVS